MTTLEEVPHLEDSDVQTFDTETGDSAESDTPFQDNDAAPEDGSGTPELASQESGFTLNPTPPVVETADIPLTSIIIDAGTQPRVHLNDDVIKEYTEVVQQAITEGTPIPFPPATVFRTPEGKIILADGFHRYAGHKGAGVESMECEIHEGTTFDAIVYSLGTNDAHGLRRTNKDKQRAVRTAVHDERLAQLSDREIGRICGVSGQMVASKRPAAATPSIRTVTRKGRTVKVDTSGIGKGKGAGKKGAKAAAKAAKATVKASGKGKGDKEAAKAPSAAPVDNSAELDKLLCKIAANCGAEGGKFRTAVVDKVLPHITLKDVKEMSEFAPAKQKAILPLVAGSTRMKPSKAFDFLASEVPAKTIEDLHNRALGAGGKFTHEDDDLTIVVTVKKKK